MERIQICGGPGAGKSTLARWLGERLNVRVADLDDLYWDPGWHEATPAQFNARIAEAVGGRRCTRAERCAAYAGWHTLDSLRHVHLVHLRSPAEVAAFVAHIEHRTAATILAR